MFICKLDDIELCNATYAELFTTYVDPTHSSPRIVSWYAGTDCPYMFAVCFASQKIQILK